MRYFVNHIAKFAKIIACCVEQIKKENDLSDDERNILSNVILNDILYVKNNYCRLEELRMIFVNSLIEPLAELALESKEENLSPSFQEVFYQVLRIELQIRCDMIRSKII